MKNLLSINPKMASLKIFLFLLVLVISNCRNITERTDYTSINKVKYGQIFRSSPVLIISIANVDSLSLEELTQFIYCLEKEENKAGRQTDLIKVYRYFCYIDQAQDDDLLILVNLKDVQDEKDASVSHITITRCEFVDKHQVYEKLSPPTYICN